MKKFFIEILSKLADIRYFSAWTVLLIDQLISIFSTTVSVLLIRLLTAHYNITGILALTVIVASSVVSLIVFLSMKTYRKAIRHTTLHDMVALGISAVLKCVLTYLLLLAFFRSDFGLRFIFFCAISDLLVTIVTLVGVRAFMIFVYDNLRRHFREDKSLKKVLVFGVSDKSVALLTRLDKSRHYCIQGFLSRLVDDRVSISRYPVFKFNKKSDIQHLKDSLGLDGILFATVDDAKKEQDALVNDAVECGLQVFVSPGIDEIIDGKVMARVVRPIHIEDLLGREEIKINLDKVKDDLSGKTVLVTGAAGSIGSELCRQIAAFGVKKLILFDNAETPMHNLRLELETLFPDLDFVPVIGDVRLLARLDFAFRKWHPQVVFHAAAYKHVPLMEENPCEAVLVNVAGSRNVADKCVEYGAEKMVMISTDKAVNPTNIMGCTKRLAEIYVQSLGNAISSGKVSGTTQFVTTRFGNVLGSNGSVIPRFRKQIDAGGPVTVTHPDINRFFMTIPEACRLVMEAACLGKNNQIFVFDMGKSVKIVELARKMITLSGFTVDKDIKIEFTGLRPGEKLYEEVLATEENTLPTSHNRIRIAKVREYDYAEAVKIVNHLEDLSRAVEIPDMVRFMKANVPEFISRNSQFEEYDRK